MTIDPSGLSADQLRFVFPFHFVLDRRLAVVQTGHTLAKLCPALCPGANTGDHLRIVRPDVPLDYGAILQHRRSFFVLELTATGLTLRARIVIAPDESQVLFLCHPWITDPDQLGKFGLTRKESLADDSASDCLFLVQAPQLIQAQYEVALILAQSSALSEAAPLILETICRELDWDVGALWLTADGAIDLHCATIYSKPGLAVDAFTAASSGRRFAKGVGIPGRVWKGGKPTWLVDVQTDPNFPRKLAAIDAGLRSAFALPVLRKGAVSGVMEFFSRQLREPDEQTLTTLSGLSTQVGDFIERVEGERRLRESEERVRLILEASLDGLVSIDESGVVIAWSRQTAAIFGWSAEEAIGRPLTDLIIPESLREAHRAGMARYLATGETRVLNRRIEVTALHESGREFPIELAVASSGAVGSDAVAATDRGGERPRLIFSAFVRDIADRREAEAQLRRAKEGAETAARARSEFLAIMSHEIRTPLHGVIGMLSLLKDTPLSEDQRRQLDIAARSARTLIAITNDILDFSKILAGRLTIERRPFDLGELVDNVAAALRPQASEAGVDLRVRCPDGRPGGVVGDALRVGQILHNLVGNAVKFTTSGYVEIRVASDGEDGLGRPTFRFVVEDTGVGVPADRQQAIFDAFTQGDDSTTRQYGGTGLGLPISSRLAEAMDGSIRLARSSAAGSVFELTIPLPAAELSPQDPARPPAAGGEFAGRVLVVDDHPVNQEIAGAMLRRLGCTTTMVGSGADAVKAVAGEPFDLVFMDCLMPEMDGYAATRAIRSLRAPGGDVPIVAMTASALPAERARCFDAGMNDHMTKPIDETALADKVRTWLRGAHPILEHDKIRRLQELLDGSDTSWDALVRAYVTEGRRSIESLQQALDRGAIDDVHREAHRLKGSSGLIAATRVAASCAALEQAAERGTVDICPTLIHKVSVDLEETAEALRMVGAR